MGLIPTATAGRFHLELDGQACGFLRSVEGGSVMAEVVTEPPDGEHYLKKHLGPPPGADRAGLRPLARPARLRLARGGLEREAVAAIRQDRLRRRHAADDKELEFEQALITSITFPKLDGASKDAACLTVVLHPEETRFQKGSGKLKSTASTSEAVALVQLPGRDRRPGRQEREPSGRVHGCDGCAGSPIDFPDLRITLAQSGAETWETWHRHFVVEGRSEPQDEKTGRLVLLDASLQEIGSVALAGLGIHRLAPEKAEAGTESVASVVAELYCERMELAL